MLIDFGGSRRHNYTLQDLKTNIGDTRSKVTFRWIAYELLEPIDFSGIESDISYEISHTKKTDMWAYGMVVFVRTMYG